MTYLVQDSDGVGSMARHHDRAEEPEAVPIRTTVDATSDLISNLERARSELEATAEVIDRETVLVARIFEGLAGNSDTILSLAAAIVAGVESDKVTSVLPTVQALGAAAKQFIDDRLQATSGIIEMVNREVRLLRQLSDIATGQEAIALEIKVLSVLTNIEVARLGAVGSGFQYLAHELADFSKSVIEDTQQLANHANSRRTAIEETRRLFSAELPRLRGGLVRIEVDLSGALAAVDSSLTQLSTTPMQFRASVEDIARQIAGVVSALQTQDITRQMTEHVQEALTFMCTRTHAAENSRLIDAKQLPLILAGLAVQIYQLQSVKATVGDWITQIRTCMAGILRVSASELLGICPIVLEQEHRVESQLDRIELLERESENYSEQIRHSLAGLSALMHLVNEHQLRSRSIRDRLRLLAFNSIVEASHLGTKADVILAISRSIKEVSAAWSQITDRSSEAGQQIKELVEQTHDVTTVFSDAGSARLHEAQAQARIGLDNLRSTAEFAEAQAQKMKTATALMHSKVSEIGSKSDRLEHCFNRDSAVLGEIESLNRQLEQSHPGVKRECNLAEVERLFGGSYTTELEREVLRAAVRGAVLPVSRPPTIGNGIELF